MKRWILAILAALMIGATAAHAQYIGIFMDTNATSCAASVGDAPWIDLHVIAILEGGVTSFSGAQFQITGKPEGWTPANVLWVPEPASAISLGHPIFASGLHPATPGVNVAFHECQTANRVLLGRVVILGAPTPGNVHLRVEGFDLVPPDPNCPFLVDCGPHFFKECVGGGEIVLNGPEPASCQMAVQSSTWTAVKSLYRETAR
jgi:hypothetical protein